MEDVQVERIIQALTRGKEPFITGSGVLDMIAKILTGVCTAGIIGVFVFLGAVNTNIQLIQQNQDTEKEARIEFQNDMNVRMTKFEEFMREPRFSERNYIEKTEPIKTQIINNSSRIDNNEKSLELVSGEVRDMAEDITIIRMAVDPNYNPSRRSK